ncbi:MAG: sugar phosphate isomerase/epimerase [Clostridia bacterium]|nr:sugar phosphate isomerase/epimerase [Clostridia bacterium]
MSMSIGLCVHDGSDLKEQFAYAKRLGFERIQLTLWDMAQLNRENAQKTKTLLKIFGLCCTEVWCGWHKPAMWNFRNGPQSLGLVPAAYRALRTQDLLRGGEYAHELGVTDVITHLGFMPPDPSDPNYVGLVVALKHITAVLAERGQVFSFETGQETPVIVRRCIEDVGAGNLGVNYDPANLLIYGNGNPVDGIDLLKDYIRSVHAKDATYPTSGYVQGVETVLGEGQVNYPLFIAKLKTIGFSGTLSIEHERGGLPEEQKERELLCAKSLLESLI